jgi:hypothetical protein
MIKRMIVETGTFTEDKKAKYEEPTIDGPH